MGVLREYHAEMGRLVLEHEGTLERFTGDGMMIFFNDPVPVPDAAVRAIRMAVAMRERVAELIGKWRKQGFELDLGVGIAQGYATIGAIGFEGRLDYGAIGTGGPPDARAARRPRRSRGHGRADAQGLPPSGADQQRHQAPRLTAVASPRRSSW